MYLRLVPPGIRFNAFALRVFQAEHSLCAAFVVEGLEIPGDNLRLHFAGKSLLQDED